MHGMCSIEAGGYLPRHYVTFDHFNWLIRLTTDVQAKNDEENMNEIDGKWLRANQRDITFKKTEWNGIYAIEQVKQRQ